jgi:hypothetical protein
VIAKDRFGCILFYLDLVISKEEDSGHPLLSGASHHSAEVLTPLIDAVVLGDFNLEQLEIGYEGRQAGGALATTSTYPYNTHTIFIS